MKTIQQELNLNVKKRKKQNRQGTTIKYMKFLHGLKSDLNEYDITNFRTMSSKYSVTNMWCTFLKNNGIIYNNENGYIKWNDKIPVSTKIVEKFKEYMQSFNMINYPNAYSKKFKAKIDAKKVIKVEPKLIHESHKNTNTQEIGLIRKFLKWIY